jgi:hypothetical protein
MFIFTSASGEPISEDANLLLNDIIDPSEYVEFNNLTHQIENHFYEWNRTHCSNCTTKHGWIINNRNEKFSYSHGCCNDCGHNLGYFSNAGTEKSYKGLQNFLLSHQELYDKVNGYFDEEQFGCSLPRHIRSGTCLSYCCNYKLVEKILPLLKRATEIRGFR